MSTITPDMVRAKYYKRFKDLYFEKFNVKLRNEEATRGMIDLLNLMKILVKPDKDK